MRIKIFNGSPKGKASNTHAMVKPFMEGATNAGAEVENIFLSEYTINHCKGCFSCWTHTPGKCVIQDDMQSLLSSLPGIDIIVYATPLYIDNVSGMTKVFMDRLLPLGTPYFEQDENGEYRHGDGTNRKGPKIIVISNAGFPEQTHFQVLSLLFKRIARNMNSEVCAEIYCGEGGILRAPMPDLQPILEQYQQLLYKAGEEIALNGKLSEKISAGLEQPLIPAEIYIEQATQYWDSVRPKEA